MSHINVTLVITHYCYLNSDIMRVDLKKYVRYIAWPPMR